MVVVKKDMPIEVAKSMIFLKKIEQQKRIYVADFDQYVKDPYPLPNFWD